MRGLAVGLTGALVIALAIAGLVEHEQRAGPWDAPLEPASVAVAYAGTYHARPWTEPVLGVCPQEPCAPHTEIHLRLHGLPDLPFEARWGGAGGDGLPLVWQRDAFVLDWQGDEDRQDERSIALLLAGRQVGAIPVAPSAEPLRIDSTTSVSWGAAPAIVHLNEIGGVTVSAVAKAALETPPQGWTHFAWFEGDRGILALGEVERGDLDARIERVGLERQHRLVVSMHPVGTDPAGPDGGLSVWVAVLPP